MSLYRRWSQLSLAEKILSPFALPGLLVIGLATLLFVLACRFGPRGWYNP